MTKTNFYNHLGVTFSEIVNLCKTKGEEYTQGDEDQLKNFKTSAKEMGISPLQVWYVYCKKHLDSIANYVKTSETKSTESIDSRFHDAILYLFLGLALIKE